jgi:hypothetical protein
VSRKLNLSNNTFRNIKYQVESDLENITGVQSFEVLPYSNYSYNFTIQPLLGGVYSGQITF